ncbi:UNVERIFIED_CONTAM: hypothetical protein HDU68_004815 [Siphonaria sp. JEL0065]|nr:hypothetical protein HDU68_004815 [Siphonaria sp. JEL0065]
MSIRQGTEQRSDGTHKPDNNPRFDISGPSRVLVERYASIAAKILENAPLVKQLSSQIETLHALEQELTSLNREHAQTLVDIQALKSERKRTDWVDYVSKPKITSGRSQVSEILQTKTAQYAELSAVASKILLSLSNTEEVYYSKLVECAVKSFFLAVTNAHSIQEATEFIGLALTTVNTPLSLTLEDCGGSSTLKAIHNQQQSEKTATVFHHLEVARIAYPKLKSKKFLMREFGRLLKQHVLETQSYLATEEDSARERIAIAHSNVLTVAERLKIVRRDLLGQGINAPQFSETDFDSVFFYDLPGLSRFANLKEVPQTEEDVGKVVGLLYADFVVDSAESELPHETMAEFRGSMTFESLLQQYVAAVQVLQAHDQHLQEIERLVEWWSVASLCRRLTLFDWRLQSITDKTEILNESVLRKVGILDISNLNFALQNVNRALNLPNWESLGGSETVAEELVFAIHFLDRAHSYWPTLKNVEISSALEGLKTAVFRHSSMYRPILKTHLIESKKVLVSDFTQTTDQFRLAYHNLLILADQVAGVRFRLLETKLNTVNGGMDVAAQGFSRFVFKRDNEYLQNIFNGKVIAKQEEDIGAAAGQLYPSELVSAVVASLPPSYDAGLGSGLSSLVLL